MSTVLREFSFENLTYGLFCKEHKLIIDGLRNEIYFYRVSRMPTFWYCFEFEKPCIPKHPVFNNSPPPLHRTALFKIHFRKERCNFSSSSFVKPR